MSKNIVFEGWLTKSPPTKRIWRTKWRRRWFALRQSGELPGQYFLDYYADRNCRRLKGTINLDLCEQVDAGLHMERAGNGSLDPKIRGSVFTIQTQSRIYHLEADCEADMEKWVDAICRVCGLRATDESPNVLETYQNTMTSVASMNDQYEGAEGTGPYIPISECITGVRAEDSHRAFTFDPRRIVMSTRSSFDRVGDNKNHQMYMSQPHIRLNNPDFSENESTLSEDECKSLNASQSNIGDWSKTFTKLAVNPKRNAISETDSEMFSGPPVPPRPPKTFAMSKDILQKDAYHGPKIQEPVESHDNAPAVRVSRLQGATPPSPSRLLAPPAPSVAAPLRVTDDEDDCSPGNASMQYCNLPSLPPAVDRALKPRHSSHSIGHINHIFGQSGLQLYCEDSKADVLQYLDLDLNPSKPSPPMKVYRQHVPLQKVPSRKKVEVVESKSQSTVETDSAYKTVDFVKTEAFNITRQDAELSRSHHH